MPQIGKIMKKSGSHIKPHRKPTIRRRLILTITSVLVLIGLLGALYSFTTHHKNKQVPLQDNSTQSTGGLAISTQSSGTISIGNDTPQLQELLRQINNARTTNGVSSVSENSSLDKSAKLKLDDMVSRGYWAHNAPDGTQWMSFIQQAGYVYRAAAENLAYGQYKYYPEQTIVNNWLNSSEHRQNMLNGTYTEIGIAFEKVSSFNGQQDVWVIVTHYGTPARQTGSASSGSSQSSSSYNPNLSQYVPPSYSSTPMPSFGNGGSSATLDTPSTPACANPALVDSSYYCGQ